MTRPEKLLDGAREWLAAARVETAAGRQRVAFEAARHAAELAAKALLSKALGEFPKTHLVAAPLAKAGLLPPGVDGKILHRLLAEFTLGTYGFDRDVRPAEVQAAIEIAQQLVDAIDQQKK